MIRIFLLCCLLFITSFHVGWGQKAQRISQPGVSYIDPEIYSDGDKIAFQSGTGNVWLADLDSLSGMFVSATGMDVLIDTGATPLVTSFNGPEFGIDSNSWSIFYTKNNGLAPQAWRATVNGQTVNRQGLTTGSVPRLSILASKSKTSGSIRLLYSKGASLDSGVFGWTDEDFPANEYIIDSTDNGVRWIDDMRKFIYTKQTGANAGQLFLYDTENQTEIQITNDSEIKTYSYGWYAPEYNQLVCLVLLNDTAMAIYKDNGNSYWDRLFTIEVPPASNYDYIGSPEAFVAAEKSYISFVTKVIATGSNYVNSEVWVVDINPDINERLMLRCDDGAPNTKRSDPESYIGENEVFIYYNLITGTGVFEIWRYATGILTNNTIGMNMHEQNFDFSIYPNPTKNVLYGDFKNGFAVYNSLGQVVIKSSNSANEIDLSFLKSGIYFVISNQRTRKIIKE